MSTEKLALIIDLLSLLSSNVEHINKFVIMVTSILAQNTEFITALIIVVATISAYKIIK